MPSLSKVDALLSQIKLPTALVPLPNWQPLHTAISSRLYGFATGCNESSVVTALSEAICNAGFILNHAERQESHYGSAAGSLSVSVSTGWIVNRENNEQVVRMFVEFWA